ncbi:DNA cytosine methyltransferase [Roseibium sp. RKSG952]|uniref:DNA cytosine methyltransferase n=1 Tax=Roseibium sp. RKSG952 TaxID=2529384 RepID=UPI0012BBCB92|nr:DNA cytosine methyltransferase [Roseibium sp. RKSG952]MTH95600.1 DNA (cytosine-5-)-methyltransferase [Roseibium sp. RKSG952]
MDSVELFGGCGGLALGIGKAGFRSLAIVEMDCEASGTLRANGGHFGHAPGVLCQDVGTVDWTKYCGVDLVAGGPPCQPFSGGGVGAGNLDPRDKWPEAIRAVREIRPRAFLFENVKGLMRKKFEDYRNSVVRALEDEGYKVVLALVDAADYGVPQRRHRVFFLGVRADLGIAPTAPRKTHSLERLVWDKWVDGTYWERVGITALNGIGVSPREKQILRKLKRAGERPALLPWKTVREALLPLGDPDGVNGHVHKEGARTYPGHTGSPLDLPSKAIKAGVHGVPGGENMFVRDDGSVRYYTVREAAEIQGFPAGFELSGAWGTVMKQIGNAVPVALGKVMATSLATAISKGSTMPKVA